MGSSVDPENMRSARAGLALEWCQYSPTRTWKTFCNVEEFCHAGVTCFLFLNNSASSDWSYPHPHQVSKVSHDWSTEFLQVGEVSKIDAHRREKGKLLRIGFWSTSLQISAVRKLLFAAKIFENVWKHEHVKS